MINTKRPYPGVILLSKNKQNLLSDWFNDNKCMNELYFVPEGQLINSP